MKLDKQFIGAGLDFDSSEEFISKNDLISAFNCRSMGTDQKELGCITSIEGNILVSHQMPNGINKCIGGKAFDEVSKAYFFIYNSGGFHRIEEYDYDSNSVTTIFENKTDSAGADILQLKPSKRIKDIILINGSLLKFNDANSSPKEIDVLKKKSGSYGVVTDLDLEQIKAQPLSKINVRYISNPSKNTNSLAKKLFQFRYKYIYWNNEESAWSVYSDRVSPTDEPTPSNVSDVTKNNGLELGLDIGTSRVRDIVISGRIGDQDWFTIKTIVRDDIIKISNKVIDIPNEVYEAYVSNSPNTNLFDTIGKDSFAVANSYVFLFYYDGLFESDDPLLSDLAYDSVPRLANAMELANGNVMLFGGITEGYERPKQDIQLGVTYYDSQISITPTDFSDAMNISYSQKRISGSHKRIISIEMYGLPKTGDKITVSMVVITSGQIYTLAEYFVPSSQNNLLSKVASSLASLIPGASVGQINPVGQGIYFTSESFQELSSVVIDYAHKTYGESKSINTIKTNSAYQASLAYKDKFGRFFPIQTNKDFILNTQSLAQTSGLLPKIDWKINSEFAPKGARTYQWLLSRNNTHLKQLTINGEFMEISDSSYIDISLRALIEFNKENPSSILSYDYAAGDRCTFEYYLDDSDVPRYFSKYIVDVEVVSFAPKMSDPIEGEEQIVEDYILKVRRPPSISMTGVYDNVNLIGKEILIEVYSPKMGTSAEETKVYYEVGDVYDVKSDGKHSVTSGSIKTGDAYFKTREMVKATNLSQIHLFFVEDSNFSDYYASDFYSFGRPRSFYDTPESVLLKSSIRFSDVYNKYTNNNGLTRFFKENIVDYDDVYGAIQYLKQRDNMLVCIQELKVGYIPVNQSIIEDQAGQQNIAVSDVLLNKIRYSRGVDLGIGKAVNSYVAYGGFIYFVDPNKCEPVRVGLDGIDTISKKASKYFKEQIREVYASGRDILGYYDVYNKEYIISYADVEDEVVSFPFSLDKWNISGSDTVLPSEITVDFDQVGGTASYNSDSGIATFTPSSSPYTPDSLLSFSFRGIKRGVGISVVRSSNTPTPFSFFPKINVPYSVYVESNAIGVGGINVPTTISISGADAEYSVDGDTWISSPSFVSNGDIVKVRILSSSSPNITKTCSLSIGGVSAEFSIKTQYSISKVYVHIGRYGSRQFKAEIRTSDVYGQGSLSSLACNVTISMDWEVTILGPIQDGLGGPEEGSETTSRQQSLVLTSGKSVAYTTLGGSHDVIECVNPNSPQTISDCSGTQIELNYIYEPYLTYC